MSLLLLFNQQPALTRYYRDNLSTLPTTAGPLSIQYSSTEVANASTVDTVYVDEAGTNTYNIHNIAIYNPSDQAVSFSFTGKASRATSVASANLQIYNVSTTTWTTLATNNTTAANGVFTLTGSQSTSLANFRDSSGYVWGRVYQ